MKPNLKQNLKELASLKKKRKQKIDSCLKNNYMRVFNRLLNNEEFQNLTPDEQEAYRKFEVEHQKWMGSIVNNLNRNALAGIKTP